VVATKSGGAARLYVDGRQVHAGTGAASDTSALPWHVMRNGTNPAFSDGEADEVALYTRALSAAEVRAHYDVAQEVAARPLPPETPDRTAEPPAAGTGLGGGVLGASFALPGGGAAPRGTASISEGLLVVRAAPRRANRLTARRRGRMWSIADAAAALRAGPGCRQAGPRRVRCRAARVERIALHGGARPDRLTLAGPARAVLDGGPGNDRLVAGAAQALLAGGPGRDVLRGGPLARFRGGPGRDRLIRRP
jgi:Concanavalin A-like lectin/glucanases superfamily/RTX calcium-binding nonapeptide repeat (4 copies)